jgi:hypothetical protein
VVVHNCSHSTQELRQEDLKFEVSLSYKVRACLKTKKEQGEKKKPGASGVHL